MIQSPFTNPNFMQICWVVPDLDAAIDAWVRQCGVGPFFRFDDGVPFVDSNYRGTPAPMPNIRAAIAYSGEVQIELVCQDNDESPSIFHDLVPRGQSGIHHLGIYCKDYDAELAAYVNNGAEVAFEGRIMGVRTSWVDTSKTLGFMVELLEAHPMREGGFKIMQEAARNWDGKNPIGTYPTA